MLKNIGLPRVGRQRQKLDIGGTPLSPEACAGFAQELLLQAKSLGVQEIFYNNPYTLRQNNAARAFLLALTQGGLVLHKHR